MAGLRQDGVFSSVIYAFSLVVLMALQHPTMTNGQCVPVSGLPFCTMVNYMVNASSFAVPGSSPWQQDKLVQEWYNKYASQQLQTPDCLDSWKSYICSFYFPMCPYCSEVNGICRSACVAMTTRCANQVQDFMGACYGGNLFVNDSSNSSICTPYTLPNATERLFECRQVPRAYAYFCQPDWMVASAPNNYTEVWMRMDNVTQTRWSTFASAGISDDCKAMLRRFFCYEYFAPCASPFQLAEPITSVLQPLCTKLEAVCPINMVRRVCAFNPYTPPNPRQCASPTEEDPLLALLQP